MPIKGWLGLVVILGVVCSLSLFCCRKTHATSEEVKMDAIATGNNGFAIELYRSLGSGNLFFSPYSISSALAMTYAGAKGKTADQMAKALNFKSLGEELHRGYSNLTSLLNAKGEKGDFNLSVANALWAQKDYGFLDSFVDLVRQSYGADLNRVDFAGQTEAARKTINDWVSEKTKQKIKDLIASGVLTRETRLVLVNAIYFLGNWQVQFDEKATAEGPFHIDEKTTVNVEMMHKDSHFKYGETDNAQLLDLPYKGGEISLIVILPKKIDGLSDLEKSLSAESLSVWLATMHDEYIEVALPKFKLTSEFRLDAALKKLGMVDAFDPMLADFSGMTGKRDLFISAVIHKAFVDVNERGTEAAAATAVTMMLSSVPVPGKRFIADHPFIFLIKENTSNCILFMGRLVNPAG